MSIIPGIYVQLQQLSISASVSLSTSGDSRIQHDSLSRSLSKLDIVSCPICSVSASHIRRRSEHDQDDFTVICVVPDSDISPRFPDIPIYSASVKSFPFFGRVEAAEWQENNIGLHLSNHLSQDSSTNAIIAATGKDLRVTGHPNNECWTIQTDDNVIDSRNGVKLESSMRGWDC